MAGSTIPETWQDPILPPCSPPSLFCPGPERGLSGRGRAANNSECAGCQRKEALLLSLETDGSDLRLSEGAEARMPWGETLYMFWDLSGDTAPSWHRGGSRNGDCGHDCGHAAFSSFFTHCQSTVRLGTSAGSGTCRHPETAFGVFWPSSKNYL